MIRLGEAYFHWGEFQHYYDYIDRLGRFWVATGKWSLHRLKNSASTEMLRKIDSGAVTTPFH